MKRRKFITVVLLIIILLCIMITYRLVGHSRANYTPNYAKIDLTSVLAHNNLTEEDYETILYQTGLGKTAVDQLIEDKNPLIEYQSDFFKQIEIDCNRIGAVTWEDNVSESSDAPSIVPLQDGDILLSLSTHTLGWRHGHAGLVIDAERGDVLEAAILGSDSQVMSLSHWAYYSNFAVLRLKDMSEDQRKKAAIFAKENLDNIPYRLFSGVFGDKAPSVDSDIGAQCAYLVWYAYEQFGYDLDSDGGKVVTVADLLASPELEIVQLHGIDPKRLERK